MASAPEQFPREARLHVFAARREIVNRLFVRAFGVYLVFAVALTLVLVGEVVMSAKDQMRQELAGHEQVFRRAMARALWDMDRLQLEALARGALDVPVIDWVSIRDPVADRAFVDLRKPEVPADATEADFVAHRFTLRFEHATGSTQVGEVVLGASGRALLPRIQRSIALLAALAIAKTLGMWLIFRGFARRLVRTPLRELTSAAVAAAPGAAHPIEFSPRTREQVAGTEFEALRDSFNALIDRIDANRRRYAELNARLESEVEKRTQELRAANERLGALASTDALTLLANRRGFESHAAVLLAQAQRGHEAVSLISMDLDQFKGINDTHGHEAGDRLLAAFAEVLRAESRSADVAARLGGDEFALLLPRAGVEVAAEVAGRIRAAWSACEVALASGTTLRTTLSAGVATSPDGSASLGLLLARADEALYEAKRSGRDRVSTARPDLLAIGAD